MQSRMERLIQWTGAILDLLLFDAPEQDEDAIAGTAIEMVLPTVAIRPAATIGDNDH